ncbi:MAG: glycoside hydrolase family 3 protein, partial [Synergistaceae bacterium]|nr:glycoside hydrolase family 3 protein [Synergistaceae bacterium]
MKKIFVFILFTLLIPSVSFANPNEILQSMTLEQKVGQLFMIRPDALDTSLSLDEVKDSKAKGVKSVNKNMIATFKKYPVGNFAFFSKNINDSKQLKHFINSLRNLSDIFSIMAIDEEGGKISRIANSKNFRVRKFESVAKIAESGQARYAGEIIGAYLKDLGFNLDFAPVADVNTNPKNIVIGDRAFGDNAGFVSKNVREFLTGLHSQGVAGCLKHFPGHGDTTGDTHKNTVSVFKTWEELLKAEIIPFRENLANTDSVMTAHIIVEKIDSKPATLSHEIITNKLRKELGYDGVIITDAMMMKAIADVYDSATA